MTSPIDVLVGRNLRALRLELNLSESECASALRLDVELYRACEAGTRRLGAGQIIALAEKLHVPLSRLYTPADDAGGEAAADDCDDDPGPRLRTA